VPNERELRRIVFPIARPDETLEEFKKAWVLRHVSADAARMICDMQRFDADDPASAALRQLRSSPTSTSTRSCSPLVLP